MNKLKKVLITVAALAALALGGAALAGATPSTITGGDDLTGNTLDRASKAALAETGGGKVTDSERDGQTYEVEVTKDDGSEVDVHLDQNYKVVVAETDSEDGDDNDDDRDERVQGADADRASKAAVAEAGGGKATEVERDGSGYDVEVTKDDGTQVDVNLDERFQPSAVDAD